MKDKLKELRYFAALSPTGLVYKGRLEEACDLIEDLEKGYTHYKALASDTAIALADSIKRVQELEDENTALKLNLSSGGGKQSSAGYVLNAMKDRIEELKLELKKYQQEPTDE